MARASDEIDSLRFSRRESERLWVALVVSVLLHMAGWGVYEGGKHLDWWKNWHTPAWLRSVAKKTEAAKPAAPDQSDPNIFVDVSHADADAPERPKFYSDKNSHAANAETANANVPKINGRQTDALKTEEASRVVKKASETPPEPKPEVAKNNPAPQPQPLQPSPPATQPAQPAQPETSTTPPTPGETELRKPEPHPAATAATPAPPVRPRTVKEALAQQEHLPSVPMQQAGGVQRHALWSSLDAKATPFGEYDRAIVEAVTQRWYDLLDSHRYAQDRTGKVTVRFKLKSDGSAIELQILDNNVGDVLGYLCQESIEEAAPFAKWPPDMLRMIGANYRDVSFTFYYY